MRFTCSRLVIFACISLILGIATAEAAGKGARCSGGLKSRCDAGLWCEPKPGRCAANHPRGRCVEVPAVCTMVYQPVCGCNGKTYSNDCARRSARVAKKHNGAC